MPTDSRSIYPIRISIHCDAAVLHCASDGATSSSVDGSARMAMAAVHNNSGTYHARIRTLNLGTFFRNPNGVVLWYNSTCRGLLRIASVKAKKRRTYKGLDTALLF